MNSRIILLLACSLGSIFFAACESTGTKAPNPAVVAKFASVKRGQMATMVIYRTNDSMGALITPTVMLNGKELINIGNGRVFVTAISPGHYTVEMDNKKTGTEVNLKAGSSVYLKVEMVPGIWIGQGKLTQIAPEQGEFEAKKLELIEPKEIENPSFR